MAGHAATRLTNYRDPTGPSYMQGVVAVLAAGCSFGLLGTLSGLAFQVGMGSSTFTGLRAAIGAVVLALLIRSGARAHRDLRNVPPRQLGALGLAVAANGTLNLALFAAYGAMSVALVLAIYFTYPVLVASASVALGRERFSRLRICGLVLAIVGLAGVISAQLGPGWQVSLQGMCLAVLCAVCQASYIVVSRAGYPDVPAEQATGVALTVGALLALVVALIGDNPIDPQVAWLTSPTAWATVLAAGTLGAAFAKVWLLEGVRRIGGTRTAVLMLAEPVVGVVAAALVLGQSMTLVQVAAGVSILGGAVLVQWPAPARRPGP